MREKKWAFILFLATIAPAFADAVSVDVAAPFASFYSISYERNLTDIVSLRLDLAVAPVLGSAALRAYDGGAYFRFYPPSLRFLFVEAGGGYLAALGAYKDEAAIAYTFTDGFAWADLSAGANWAPFGKGGPFFEPSAGCKLLAGSLKAQVTSANGDNLASANGPFEVLPALRLALRLGWRF
jgi:hypothetical protein